MDRQVQAHSQADNARTHIWRVTQSIVQPSGQDTALRHGKMCLFNNSLWSIEPMLSLRLLRSLASASASASASRLQFWRPCQAQKTCVTSEWRNIRICKLSLAMGSYDERLMSTRHAGSSSWRFMAQTQPVLLAVFLVTPPPPPFATQ